MAKTKKYLERKYSGLASGPFWDRINKIRNKRERDLVYLAACALQDHENRVFQMLKCAKACGTGKIS